MHFKKVLTALALALACNLGHAATVIGFDDITGAVSNCVGTIIPGAACISIPGNYQGFTWDNGWVVNGCAYTPGSGYCKSTVSPPNVLFNGYSRPLTIKRSDGSQFNYFGASVGLAWAPGPVTFAGLRNGATVYSTSVNLSLNPIQVNVYFYNIDTLYITSQNQIALDSFSLSPSLCQTPNLTYNVTSPALLGNQIYYSFADFNTCMGSLTATALNQTTGAYAQTPTWDGGCTLSGPAIPPTTQVPTGPKPPCYYVPPSGQPAAAQGISNRTLVTYDPDLTQDQPLFHSNLTDSEYTNAKNAEYGNISWLRYIAGDTTQEGLPTATGKLRQRTSQLGDIVDSSPTVVGPPNAAFDQMTKDLLTGASLSTEASAYAAFKTKYANRANVIYVGANDGFLHAFRGGTQNSSGVTVGSSIPNDGRELLAYAPATPLSTLYSPDIPLNYSDQSYNHNYFVDATAGTGDAYINGAWQTLLIGGLGAGGNATGPVTSDSNTAASTIYLLNVTDPNNFTTVSAQNALNVQAEVISGQAGVAATRSQSPLTCSKFTDTTPIISTACIKSMGAIYGTPVIQRMHNGNYDAIVGNGLYSLTGNAGIFILDALDNINDTNNYFLAAPSPVITGQKNGVVQVTPVDLDGDQVIDYIYAGDLQGNVWRYDVTGANASAWYKTPPVKIFSTPNGQPITTKLMVTTVNTSTGKSVLIEFGTGRAWPLLNSFGNNYATGTQSIYGIWDWQMANWNAVSATKFNSLATLPAGSALVTQQLGPNTILHGITYRTMNAQPVCWIGAANIPGCSKYTNYGWKIDLPGIGNAGFQEQVVFNPQLLNGTLVVNTLTPGWPLNTSVGYSMTITNVGGAPPTTFFADAASALNVVGAQLSGLGTAVFYSTTNSQVKMYQKDVYQNQTVTNVNTGGTALNSKRLTWAELR
jgi:type IV pilus assembly protein PilY1